MFDSLDERIQQDEPESTKGRVVRYVVIADFTKPCGSWADA